MTTLGDTEATAVILDATQGAAAYDAAGAAAAAQSAAATDATTKANAAQAAAIAASQPVDSDLTAIAALTTTSYGRALLALADAAAARTALALGTAATHATGDYDAAGSATAAVAAEATARDAAIAAAVAALINSAPGVLDTLEEIADALGDDPNFAATMTTALAGKQPIDSDLTAIAALTTTSYGRSLLEAANAAALRTLAGLGTLATQSGTFSGTSSGTNTGDQTVPAFATPSVALGTAAAAGAASTVIRSDATILAFDATAPVTQASADAAATGAATVAARRDHKHGMPTIPAAAAGGTPALTLGTTNAAGSSGTFVRDDDTILAFDATVPTTSAFGDAAATGSATVAARRDHLHGRGALGTTAAAIGTSAGGSATTPSKSDHVHATGAGTPSSQAFGDAAATGSGPAAAMTDHKHAMPANPDGISWTLVTKGSDQSLNTSTTMTNDTALLFATTAGGLYQFECLLIYASPLGAGTPDIKIGGGEDATIRGIMNAFGWSVTDAVFAGGGGGIQTGTAAVTQGTAAAKRMARIFGTFLAVGGTFTIQWAQNVSNANDVTVYTGSVLMYRRIA